MKRIIKLIAVGFGLALVIGFSWLLVVKLAVNRLPPTGNLSGVMRKDGPADFSGQNAEMDAEMDIAPSSPASAPIPDIAAKQRLSDEMMPKKVVAQSAGRSAAKNETAEKPIEVKSKAAERKVQYDASAKLSVDSPEETYKQVGQMANQNGGFVQSLNKSEIIVRVPVATVRAVFQKILGLGIVLEKWMRAEDISDAFYDTELRIRVDKALLAKLRQYLVETKDNRVRLSLLREVEELTQEIIQLESQLRQMEHVAAFSSITVQAIPRKEMELKSIPEDVAAFRWILALNPMSASLPLIRLTDDEIPKGFVITEARSTAETAEGDIYRLSKVRNNPEGDQEFWQVALRHRLTQRFTLEKEEKVGDFVDFALKMPSGDPVRYHVLMARSEEVVRLLEVTYLSPVQEAKYHEGVREILAKLR